MHLSRRTFLISSIALPVLVGTKTLAYQEAGGDAQTRLRTMLDYLPGGTLDGGLDIAWTDYASHFARFPDAEGDELSQLAPSSEASNLFLNRQETISLLGLDILDVNQAIVSGVVPEKVAVLEMGIDLSGLPAIWEASGYEQRDLNGTPFWTIGEDAEVDLGNPVNLVMMARANNLAIVNDSLIVMATRSALLADVLDTITGNRPGRAAEFESVIAGLPQNTANLWILDGEIVAAVNPDSANILAESEAAVGAMPEILTVAIGQSAGATWDIEAQPEDVSGFIVLQAAMLDDAGQIATVAEWRLQNMVSGRGAIPFAEIVGPVVADVPTEGVARVSVSGGDRDMSIFTRIIMNGDTAPFAYIPA